MYPNKAILMCFLGKRSGACFYTVNQHRCCNPDKIGPSFLKVTALVKVKRDCGISRRYPVCISDPHLIDEASYFHETKGKFWDRKFRHIHTPTEHFAVSHTGRFIKYK
jgi:hypothetical protein